jgi:hypothetical protein
VAAVVVAVAAMVVPQRLGDDGATAGIGEFDGVDRRPRR